MNPAEEIPPEVAHRAYYRQPVWKRIVVIAAGPAVNIVLAFVILWVLFWCQRPAGGRRRASSASSTGMPAADGAPAGRPDRRRRRPARRRPTRLPQADRVAHAARASRQPGCQAATPALVTSCATAREQTVTVRAGLRRRGQAAAARLRLRHASAPTRRAASPRRADASTRCGSSPARRSATIAQIFKPEKRKQISGVVGSYEATRQSDRDLAPAARSILLALISLSLGVINLFPFLPLDGGHIFWALAEKVRGRAIPFSVMERAGFVGFALVIVLFVIGLTNDIGRLTGEGFGVR